MWYGDSRDDAGLNFLDSRPFTTAFVSGNHENYDALAAYPPGGVARRQGAKRSALDADAGAWAGVRPGGQDILHYGRCQPMTSRTAFWSRRAGLPVAVPGVNAQGAPSGSTTAPGGGRSCPMSRSMPRPGPTSTELGGLVDYLLTHCVPPSRTISGAAVRFRCPPQTFWRRSTAVPVQVSLLRHYHRNEIVRKMCAAIRAYYTVEVEGKVCDVQHLLPFRN